MAPRQLALPFVHAPHYGADFLAAPGNEAALAWLARTPSWPGLRLAVWGEEGGGKTHLLHLWAAGRGAALLPGPLLRGMPPAPCHGAAVDDADAAPEEPLLHLLNGCAEAGRPVLLAGRAAPARWPVRLPDLASRLRATTAVAIGRADDALLRALLARLLADRQLAVPEPVREWMLLRLPRSPAALREAVARLDRAALAAGGRVTRGLAAAVVESLAGEEAEAPAASPDGPRLL